MNKLFVLLLFGLFSSVAFSQSKKEKPSLESFQRRYKYVPNKSYKGPENKYSQPTELKESENPPPESDASSSSNGGKIEYSPEQIEKTRQERQQARSQSGSSGNGGGNGKGGGNGSNGSSGAGGGQGGNGSGQSGSDSRHGSYESSEPIDYSSESYDSNEYVAPENRTTYGMGTFWKVFLISLAAIALIILIYYLVKNHRPRNKKVKREGQNEGDLNPLTITKTELELRREKAMNEGNYRECVRIYFTFILKEMIRLRFIRWKKELTNYDYILQSLASPFHKDFEESVHIYDLVWYGDYQIGLHEYEQIAQHLEKNYKQLNASNA